MSSYSRRTVLLGAAALSACGFTPAYGPGGGADRLDGNVAVDAPTTQPAYRLVRHLEDRLGRAAAPRYGLSHAIRINERPSAISDDNITLRYNLLGEVTYALRDLDSGEVLTSGKVDSFTSYSTSGTTVATEAAKRDASDRLMVILGDAMITRLVAVAPGLPA